MPFPAELALVIQMRIVRHALNLVRELGVSEMTGRGRYRGWGVL